MKKQLTDITLVVDRSGSMDAIREDAEGGINAFIQNQAQEQGEAVLTLVQFDTHYDFVHLGTPIQQVPHYRLLPRGSTALLDAIGRAIIQTGQRLASMSEADRPGLVVFVVMTDGWENASREFTKHQIRQMIEHQQRVYSWQFTFLGADQDAFAEASSMGIGASGAACFTKKKVGAAFGASHAKLSRMRHQLSAGEPIDNRFTEAERAEMI